MDNFNKYIGKSICINRDEYPVYFFNVQEYNSRTKELVAEQILQCFTPANFNSRCCYVDSNYDTVSLVCNTPDELFADLVKYLKEQIEHSSGIHLS